MIGYGATLGEGSLALAATIAAVAGVSFIATDSNLCLPWVCNFNNAKASALSVFIEGSAGLLQQIGLSASLSITLIVVLIVSFAATTLDSATRIQRYIITEFGIASKIKLLENKYLATMISIVPAYLIAVNENLRNELWTTFGASNQMLASLTLMIISIYFWKQKKFILPLVIPMISIALITISALVIKFQESTTNLLLVINGVLIFLILWMITEGLIYYMKNKNE